MSFRQIDARGIWLGDAQALRVFRKAFYRDCKGDRKIWHKVYAWTPEVLSKAIADSEGLK